MAQNKRSLSLFSFFKSNKKSGSCCQVTTVDPITTADPISTTADVGTTADVDTTADTGTTDSGTRLGL